jgi:hypothetical protein
MLKLHVFSAICDGKGTPMVRISSREWTSAQIELLSILIAAGSTAANAAIILRRSVTVVQAKARSLRTPFRINDRQ